MSSQTFDAETVDAIFSERDQLKAENAKLVDVLHEVETEAVYAYHCLQQDCMTTADSSEHFFKKWWHAECELDRLKAENAMLRELVQDYHRYEHEDCYACRYINECRADESGRCIAPMRLGERYRELGIEVDE